MLASSDANLIADMKKQVAIWNINSFAEFYMQIEEKYKKDYDAALVVFKETRRKLAEQLNQTKGVRVVPSQANYIMVELLGKTTAKELTKNLLVKHSLLIKDLSGKIPGNGRQFIRLAIRNEADNQILINALRKEMEEVK